MKHNLELHGIDPCDALEATIERWIARIECARPLAACAVQIRSEVGRWGAKKAFLDLRLVHADGEIELTRERPFRERADLYSLVADAFRAAYQRMGSPKATRKTSRLIPVRAVRHA